MRALRAHDRNRRSHVFLGRRFAYPTLSRGDSCYIQLAIFDLR